MNYIEFQKAVADAGFEARKCHDDHWQIRAAKTVNFNPSKGTIYVQGEDGKRGTHYTEEAAIKVAVKIGKPAPVASRQQANDGWSARERFAAAAIQGLCANPFWVKLLFEGEESGPHRDWRDVIAIDAREIAEALVDELERTAP